MANRTEKYLTGVKLITLFRRSVILLKVGVQKINKNGTFGEDGNWRGYEIILMLKSRKKNCSFAWL